MGPAALHFVNIRTAFSRGSESQQRKIFVLTFMRRRGA